MSNRRNIILVEIDHCKLVWTDIHSIQKEHCATTEDLVVVLMRYPTNSLRLSHQPTFLYIFLFELSDVECYYFPML